VSTTLPVTKTLETELAVALATIERLTAAMTPTQRDNASIASLQATILTLGKAEIDYLAKIEALTAENTSLKTREGDLEKRASAMALDIAGGQGVPAVNMERGGGIRATAKTRDELHVEYAQIADPVARAQFYAKHEVAMFKKD
jgi:hypothetical protein